jgi:beta-phosphoglucomutase-like phosphatase (HAD superfamily)
VLGLPDGVTACLFDLDGVLTDTAAVHNRAWKETFDAFLRERPSRRASRSCPSTPGPTTTPSSTARSARTACATSSPAAGIELPEGAGRRARRADRPRASATARTTLLLRLIDATASRSTRAAAATCEAAATAGLRRRSCLSSANTAQVLEVTGLAPLVELRVDGVTARERACRASPAPDTFLARGGLGRRPSQAVVFEDALAGAEAGRAGRFGIVIGVDRVGQADELRARGADVVVQDLDELLP